MKVPVSRIALQPVRHIFKSPFQPKYIRDSQTADFPMGRLPCLTRPLTSRMEPHGWEDASPMEQELFNKDPVKFPLWHYKKKALL